MGDRIKDVWAADLEAAMSEIRRVVQKFPYVAMDTEFPGIVARPVGSFATSSDYHYQTLRCNVDLLRIIQLGVTLSDANGELPDGVCTWQFNFRFSINADMYAPDSIKLLTESGINFKRHEEQGIDVELFGELLIASGLALQDEIKWISFHSGYDFGYLLKVCSCSPLPLSEREFFELLRIWFPCIYDIKYLMKSCKSLKGGLQDVADDLQVSRIGPQHQAGSDSLLTASTFFKMRSRFFEDHIDDDKYKGYLFGLGQSLPKSDPGHQSGTPFGTNSTLPPPPLPAAPSAAPSAAIQIRNPMDFSSHPRYHYGGSDQVVR